ncbi:11079_t:CDS:10 [Ambispora gerdemannii]|uniref:11079_t:CDS:1 n=1 Tax=Ambispora gerdemannii TaxID=144530 RepID=A0A9N8YMJ9_9GLOM|nr:11079_t:CDS:10 [Ambispora gerdemannii]
MSNSFAKFNMQVEELDYETLEAEEWRDPVPPRQEQQLGEAEEAQAWKEDLTNNAIPRNNMPDDVWLIPPNMKAQDILGEKRCTMELIKRSTNTHMQYNEKDATIELWGTRADIDQAIKQWNSLASNLLLDQERKSKKNKSRSWAKPEKPLTRKQIEKLERRKKREDEMKDYQGFSVEKRLYNGFFVCPNKDIKISSIVGDKEEVLHSVRAETKCYMWYEPGENTFMVVGDNYENTEEATMRIKNLYLKAFALRSIPKFSKDSGNDDQYRGWSYHMIEQPQTPSKVKIVIPPKHLKLPHDAFGEIMVLEAVAFDEEKKLGQTEEECRRMNEEALKKKTAYIMSLQSINVNNLAKIERALLRGLSTVHLLDEEIKMRVRFGHVCFTDFPKQTLWDVDRLNDRVLSDSRLQSKFANCIADNRHALEPLFEVLSENDKLWEGSPFREFKIRAEHGAKKWGCTFDVQFKKDDKIGLWNAVAHEKHILNINMTCLENDYSWRISLDAAKRMTNDKHSSQGLFVYRLRLSPGKHLIYTNTEDVRVISVCEKTKWKHWWKDDYIVEVTRYEFWNCDPNKQTGVENILDLDAPVNTSYGVTFYRKSWDDDFAFNCNLKVGEAPDWHPTDAIDRDKTGGVDKLLNDIREFMNTLEQKVPIIK